MNPKTAAVGAALALAALGAALVVSNGKGGTIEVAATDFESADSKEAVSVDALRDAGVSVGWAVFQKPSKDGSAYFYKEAGGWVKVDSSPCRMRPKGAKPSDCMHVAIPESARFPNDDGGLVDFGDENVMQPGEWVGAGCVEVPCVTEALSVEAKP